MKALYAEPVRMVRTRLTCQNCVADRPFTIVDGIIRCSNCLTEYKELDRDAGAREGN